MFTVTHEQRQYLTYQLTDTTTDTQLAIVPERGGIWVSWQIAGKELFYLDTERFKDPALSVRGGNPILFPICGNLPNNQFTHNSQTYTLKQHGFARELAWEVIGQSTSGSASLTLALQSTPATLAVYPFAFEVQLTYELTGTTVTITQDIINHSTEPMPFSIGFHPYFAVADKQQLSFSIPSTQQLDQRTKEVTPFDNHFDFDQEEIDASLRPLTALTAQVKNAGKTLTLNYDEQFSTLVFWTVKGKDFYCLEPWTAPRNALVTGENLLTVAPSASQKLQVSYKVE